MNYEIFDKVQQNAILIPIASLFSIAHYFKISQCDDTINAFFQTQITTD